ncbi:MAG: MgtE intracellular domain protein [Firmicutes bacterium]|nr:MgtE intracellular domain protein [Bacillota bacterium]
MVNKKKPPVNEPVVEEVPRKKRRWLKTLAIFVVILLLLGLGIGAGFYLGFIDTDRFVQNHKLYDYPIVGKYFSKPATNFEMTDGDEVQQPNELPKADNPVVPQIPETTAMQPVQTPQAAQSQIPITNAEEMAKIMEKAKQEEAKRTSKTARLLGSMKPDEAVPIINQLDTMTVVAVFNRMEEEQVAQILAKMDSQRAADITRSMLKGK